MSCKKSPAKPADLLLKYHERKSPSRGFPPQPNAAVFESGRLRSRRLLVQLRPKKSSGSASDFAWIGRPKVGVHFWANQKKRRLVAGVLVLAGRGISA
jgi:hypothetical protein